MKFLFIFLIFSVTNTFALQYYCERCGKQYFNPDINRHRDDSYVTDQDRVILHNIRNALKGNPQIKDREIILTVENQNVTVDGNVYSEEEWDEVDYLIHHTPDVKNVDNHVEIGHDLSYANYKKDLSHQKDHELLDRIQQTIKDPMGKYRDVQVHILKNAIILTGAINNDDERQELKVTISKIPGVQRIDDKLDVRPAQVRYISYYDPGVNKYKTLNEEKYLYTVDMREPTDADIRLKVREALKSYDGVIINVSNGFVTLSGSVDNIKDRKDVMSRAYHIRGVKGVEDQIAIRAP